MPEEPKIEEPAIARTDAAVPAERLQRDVARVLEAVYGGGVAIIPLDVAYAIIGQRPEAIRSIFDAKQRSYEKPSGMFGNWQMSRDIQLLPDEKHDMVRTIIEEERLPFSVVAPFREDHRIFADVDPFVLDSSTKAGTLDMLLNAGIFHDEVARQSYERSAPIFGSSANTSLKGSKYRLQDVEGRVRGDRDRLRSVQVCQRRGQVEHDHRLPRFHRGACRRVLRSAASGLQDALRRDAQASGLDQTALNWDR